MNRETLYISNDAQIKALEKKIDELYAIIENSSLKTKHWWLDEWRTDYDYHRLGKTKLYELRNTGTRQEFQSLQSVNCLPAQWFRTAVE